tara:strand:+ start:784 stop:1116 length:333 start_codon:yes stop_codon:yes gene_type:complete
MSKLTPEQEANLASAITEWTSGPPQPVDETLVLGAGQSLGLDLVDLIWTYRAARDAGYPHRTLEEALRPALTRQADDLHPHVRDEMLSIAAELGVDPANSPVLQLPVRVV